MHSLSFPQQHTDYYYYATAGGAKIWVSRHDCIFAGATTDSCPLFFPSFVVEEVLDYYADRSVRS